MILGAGEEVYLAPIIAVSFTAVIGLMAWIVRELARISTELGRISERGDDHDRRIRDLELGR